MSNSFILSLNDLFGTVILHHICSYCNMYDILILRRCSKQIYDFCNNDHSLWYNKPYEIRIPANTTDSPPSYYNHLTDIILIQQDMRTPYIEDHVFELLFHSLHNMNKLHIVDYQLSNVMVECMIHENIHQWLIQLDLTNCDLTHTYVHLSRFNQLHELYLTVYDYYQFVEEYDLPDSMLLYKQLSHLHQLQTLHLLYSNDFHNLITPSATHNLGSLAACTQLTELKIDCNLSEYDVAGLSQLHSLRKLLLYTEVPSNRYHSDATYFSQQIIFADHEVQLMTQQFNDTLNSLPQLTELQFGCSVETIEKQKYMLQYVLANTRIPNIQFVTYLSENSLSRDTFTFDKHIIQSSYIEQLSIRGAMYSIDIDIQLPDTLHKLILCDVGSSSHDIMFTGQLIQHIQSNNSHCTVEWDDSDSDVDDYDDFNSIMDPFAM